ncbi:MAG TPA: hypothetical protein PL117_18365 [Accumulibacter sp.]|uniref:hypothetical protein n=1 Tax=Accumulibacter sp. TaxID=2053492 RepID=UPI002CDADDA7|nr:hypothetical protein [Accumulibacter sp.]HRF74733.1 hypothetical protein [Accumulibacter sp.]
MKPGLIDRSGKTPTIWPVVAMILTDVLIGVIVHGAGLKDACHRPQDAEAKVRVVSMAGTTPKDPGLAAELWSISALPRYRSEAWGSLQPCHDNIPRHDTPKYLHGARSNQALGGQQ